jgi:hypothetical protein
MDRASILRLRSGQASANGVFLFGHPPPVIDPEPLTSNNRKDPEMVNDGLKALDRNP